MNDQLSAVHAREAAKIQPVQPVAASQLKNNEDESDSKKSSSDVENTKVKPVEETTAIVDKMNDFLQSFSTKLQFKFDPESNATKILVMEKDSDRVIRQIPPDEIVNLRDKMDEISGILFNTEA